LATHTQCERDSDWETQSATQAASLAAPSYDSLAARRCAYEDAVASALLDESDEERDERLALVVAAQELVMRAYSTHQIACDPQDDVYATPVHSA